MTLSKQENDARKLDYYGTFLKGERWQNDLAEDLGVNARTLRGWLVGRSGIRPEVWLQIETLVHKKVEEAKHVLSSVRERARQARKEAA